jgi:small-conductance mechanosensitive channel
LIHLIGLYSGAIGLAKYSKRLLIGYISISALFLLANIMIFLLFPFTCDHFANFINERLSSLFMVLFMSFYMLIQVSIICLVFLLTKDLKEHISIKKLLKRAEEEENKKWHESVREHAVKDMKVGHEAYIRMQKDYQDQVEKRKSLLSFSRMRSSEEHIGERNMESGSHAK